MRTSRRFSSGRERRELTTWHREGPIGDRVRRLVGFLYTAAMKRPLNALLRRFGYELRALEPDFEGAPPEPSERTAVEDAIARFVASQPAGGELADAAEWRDYLSDRRLVFFREVLRVCDEAGVRLDGREIADVGSGTGYLLRLIAQRAPDAMLRGYDHLLRRPSPGRGRSAQTATFETRGVGEIDRQADVVFCHRGTRTSGRSSRRAGADAPDRAPGRRPRADRARRPSGPAGRGSAPRGRNGVLGACPFLSPESWHLFVEGALPDSAEASYGRLVTNKNYAVARL